MKILHTVVIPHTQTPKIGRSGKLEGELENTDKKKIMAFFVVYKMYIHVIVTVWNI